MSVRFAKPYEIVDDPYWTAIKYPDGRSECYRLVPVENVQTSIAAGGVYYGMVRSPDFPTNLFISVPVVEATFLSDGSKLAFLFGISGTSATNVGNITLGRNDITTLNGYVAIRAIGRWK